MSRMSGLGQTNSAQDMESRSRNVSKKANDPSYGEQVLSDSLNNVAAELSKYEEKDNRASSAKKPARKTTSRGILFSRK